MPKTGLPPPTVSLLRAPTIAVLVAAFAVLLAAAPAAHASAAEGKRALAFGSTHSCAIQNTGQVTCWGNNSSGKLGGPNTTGNKPVTAGITVSGINDAVGVAVGQDHSCALLRDGTVSCWGSGRSGQLGDGTHGAGRETPVPVAVIGINDAAEITAGRSVTCARHATGEVSCWGAASDGALGNNDPDAPPTGLPAKVGGLTGVVSLSTGGRHTCAVRGDGTAACWGRNYRGELGSGTPHHTVKQPVPVVVSGIAGAKQVALGDQHTCMLLRSGGAQCFGAGFRGQLGDGQAQDSVAPVTVAGLTGVISIAAGSDRTCAVLNNASLRCWGAYNGLGDGTSDRAETNATTPVAVAGITTAIEVATDYHRSCAIVADGSVKCWGYNYNGVLGYDTRAATPAQVTGLAGPVSSLSAGRAHTCARLSDASVQCWGDGYEGRLGDGLETDSPTPVTVSGLEASMVTAGRSHTCALATNQTVWCWGGGDDGQLGNGDKDDSLVPVQVRMQPGNAILDGVDHLDAGDDHTCAVRGGGFKDVLCWGEGDYGQLGDGNSTATPRASAVALPAGVVPRKIAAGGEHTCVTTTTAAIYCWGAGWWGQLGHGSAPETHGNDKSTPELALHPARATEVIAAGSRHTCASEHAGPPLIQRIRCWGNGEEGQLGDGTTNSRGTAGSFVRLDASPISSRAAIAAGAGQTCAVERLTRQLHCWGAGESGELGVGKFTDQPTPVAVPGMTLVNALAAGSAHTCAARDSGAEVWCWGEGERGQLGTGYAPGGHYDSSYLPVSHASLTNARTPVVPDGGQPPLVPGPPPLLPPAPEVVPRVVPMAKPKAITRLSTSVRLHELTVRSTSKKSCAKRASVTLREVLPKPRSGGKARRGASTTKRLTLRRVGKTCRVTGTVKLTSKLRKAAKLTVTTSGARIRSQTRSVPSIDTVARTRTSLVITALALRPVKRGKCPARTTVTVSGDGAQTTAKLRLSRTKKVCVANGTVRLGDSVRFADRLIVTFSDRAHRKVTRRTGGALR